MILKGKTQCLVEVGIAGFFPPTHPPPYNVTRVYMGQHLQVLGYGGIYDIDSYP